MKLIITRHGETEENKVGIIQGQLPGKLSNIGINQAKKVALRLKDEKIDFIYSSDLTRASDTAKEISTLYQNIPIKFVKDLRERFLGEWQGKTKKELGFTKKTWITGISPKNGENYNELLNRAKNFFNKILLKHPNNTILFVGHNGINKAIIAAITNKEIDSIENLHNTSVSIFEIDKNKTYKIKILNDTKHLIP